MCMRPTPGCGTLGSPSLSLVLPVSLMLKQRRSGRGHSAGAQLQRAPGRPGPGKPPNTDEDIVPVFLTNIVPVIFCFL